MTEIQRAIWFSILNQYSLIAVGFVSIAILARLLTPEEIGVFAVATSIAFIASSIRSLGVGEYLIREKDIDARKVKSVIGVMMAISWSLGIVLLAGSGWIATYYKVDDLTTIFRILAIPFFLAPFVSIPYSLLIREMKFDSILRVDLAGGLVNAVFSIGLVMLGYSYFGLAWGTLLGVIAEFLIVTWLRPAYMSWIPALEGFGRILKTGFLISTGRTFAMVSQNSSELILGRLARMSDVGFYSRGLGLIMFIQNLLVNSVGPTALPHLSQVNRSGGDVGEAYLSALTLIGAFTLPVFAVITLAAGPLITVMFGDQWTTSVSVASTLAIWAMLQSVHCFSNPALLATGKERVLPFKEAASMSVKISIIILMVPHGLDWVAWGFVASGVFDLIMITFIMKYTHGISVLQLVKACLPNVQVAAACWIAMKALSLALDLENGNAWVSLSIIVPAMAVVWLLALKLSRNRAWPYVRDIVLRTLKIQSAT